MINLGILVFQNGKADWMLIWNLAKFQNNVFYLNLKNIKNRKQHILLSGNRYIDAGLIMFNVITTRNMISLKGFGAGLSRSSTDIARISGNTYILCNNSLIQKRILNFGTYYNFGWKIYLWFQATPAKYGALRYLNGLKILKQHWNIFIPLTIILLLMAFLAGT